MFFPAASLRRGGRFYLCWVADSWPLRFATITHKQLWSQDIREICDDLLEVMKNESGRPANRFSLRLSSQLLRGLVRLYQRKVSVFVAPNALNLLACLIYRYCEQLTTEICMINARVMKATNKKWVHDSDDELVERRVQRAVLVIEEQADEERVEERIQNSGNVVANVEEITLKEPTLPQIQALIDDGFGELNMQMQERVLALDMQEQAMELQMRAGGQVEQVSALSLPAEESRSRLELSTLKPVMEGVSEHDISVFKKSMGESQLPAADFDKEIPDMPEIHPEPPAPQIDNTKSAEAEITDNQLEELRENSSDKRKKDNEEFVLDELQERPQAKRRRKNKLIIDKSIKLSSQFMKSRTQNVDVELRCEKGADRISTIVPASILLSRPAHAGCAARSNLGYTLARAFIRNLDVPDRLPEDDRLMEIALTARQRRSTLRAAQQSFVEEPVATAEAREVQQEMQQELRLDLQQEIQPEMDFSLLPTQIVITSPQKRAGESEHSAKRIRRSGFVSFRLNQQLEIMKDANDKENVPQNYQSVIENNKENVAENHQDASLAQMLEAAGLADVDRPVELSERPNERYSERPNVRPSDRPSERPRIRESSETPLGSLDRTKVSLGDSEKTTDSKRFIREEWGTHGTMHKIYRWVRTGDGPVRLQSLLARGPWLAGHRRIIAARCFTSLLKLKQHGFINVIKDPETYEILDIQLGNKFILSK